MLKKIAKSKTRQCLITLCLAMVALASTASAEQAAKIGTLHTDGRVEVFLDRFLPTISTDVGITMPVKQTFLNISNGFVRIVRLGDDGCTAEEFSVFTKTSVNEPFTGLASHLASGDYTISPLFPMTTTVTAKVDLWVFGALITKCENVDCGSSSNPAICERYQVSNGFDCRCIAVDLWPDDDQPVQDQYPPAPGCEKRLDFRPWWSLQLSVDSNHVEG